MDQKRLHLFSFLEISHFDQNTRQNDLHKRIYMNFNNFSFLPLEEEVEFIPLIDEEEEDILNKQDVPEEIAILPIKNTVMFPGVIMPINAGREKSIRLINQAQKNNQLIGIVSQKNDLSDDPTQEEIYKVGTIARIIRLLKLPDGNLTIILQGIKRFRWLEMTETTPYFKANIETLEEKIPKKSNKEFAVIVESIKEVALRIIKENPMIPSEASHAISNINSPSLLINFVSSNLSVDVKEKQKLLQMLDLKVRSLETLKHLDLELQKLELKNEVHSKVRTDIDQQQREYFLQQQIKTIQEELGGFSHEEELDDFRKIAKTKKWNKEVSERFDKELLKYQRLNSQSPEHSIQRSYLELMLDLPWGEFTQDKFNLKKAEQVLNRDHFGLEKVKERILEYLAVLKLRNDMKSPIICLYGPPGVGKTSLGKSIAEALGRKYARISLGGLHDESEIRGHRKTYIGAMPGRIVQSLKKVKTANPVFVLDEIDKIGSTAHGDPSSAMLEVLDPEQNIDFYDNYLEMGFDLSKVMFVATANSLDTIHPALLDRMELINVSGYIMEEKVEIAKRHLLPKQLVEHGMLASELKISKKQWEHIVEGYTREAGVRGLNKTIAKIVRNSARTKAMEEELEVNLSDEKIEKILGKASIRDKYETNATAGVVTGLAWTRVGGDILFIESILTKGKGTLSITGNLGKVMKESAQIALEFIKANHEELGINPTVFDSYNVHIHVPEGATPKDGPSAGITMLTSLVSSYTQRQLKPNLAMTGEITLRGKVLPVGGIKEKILAAKRANIKTIVLCKENQKDVEEVKAKNLAGLSFHYVEKMEEVIAFALLKKKVDNPKIYG